MNREQLEQAKNIIDHALGRWPYTPPEMLPTLYWQATANVMNTLDPEGKCIVQEETESA